MAGDGGGTTITGGPGGIAAASFDEVSDLLPFELVRSQLIPPAANRRASAIDWLPDFGGSSWIAYGAASLLVISHFPSPSSDQVATIVGPFYRQVIEPPSDHESAEIASVSWCPAQPSEGEIAVALGNGIWMYKPLSTGPSGSFCWRQSMEIMETFSVKTIGWTGFGDGLIAAGTEVVMWIRKNNSWEMSWKSKTEVPQSLISATSFAHGPVATASDLSVQPDGNSAEDLSSFSRDSSNCVLVHHQDANFEIAKFKLYHPQSVLNIQWRPPNWMRLQKDSTEIWRDVLMTCCLDGTVRLWSEVDYGKIRESKEIHDPKNTERFYHVIAVIEVNQLLKGSLGTNIDVRWAVEYGGLISKGEGNTYYLRQADLKHKQVGKCDWLVGVGPNFSVTFWSIHCLDDISPMRFPRATLWKKQDFSGIKELNFHNSDFSNSKKPPVLTKIVTARNYLFGPPVLCSLLHLLPDNSVSWTRIYTSAAAEREEDTISRSTKERSLSCIAGTVLNEDGHSGNIIEVAVHPYSSSIELAASLDSNGLVLIWSLSSLPACFLTMQRNLHPLWKLLGRISLDNCHLQCIYSCLLWAPLILDNKQFLLVGRTGGIDCFIIQVSPSAELLLSHKMLTIPFDVYDINKDPPSKMFVTPLSPKYEKSCDSSSFLLNCIWMKRFKLLSWKVDLHSEIASVATSSTLSGTEVSGTSGKERYIYYAGKCYSASFCRQSAVLPAEEDDVTCVDIVAPCDFTLLTQQDVNSSNGFHHLDFGYRMATGCSDGTVKLWKVSNVNSANCTETEFFTWELVGKLTAHKGPISAVSSAGNNGKVATASLYSPSSSTRLHIWQPVWLIDHGSFLLEDVITLEEPIISLSWLSIGNGQLLLGVCLPNQLRIYSQRRFPMHLSAPSEKTKDKHIWHCIAFFTSVSILKDFIWGPKLTSVVVHENHFSVLSQWLFRKKGAYTDTQPNINGSIMLENSSFATKVGRSKSCFDESSKNWKAKKSHLEDHSIDIQSDIYGMTEILDMLNGSLALYCPEVLIQCIYSGNWNRARVVLKHFVESIMSKAKSETNIQDNKYMRTLHYLPEVPLSNYFEENSSTNSSKEGLSWGNDRLFEGADSETNTLKRAWATSERSEIMGFIEILERFQDIANVSEIERTKILVILDLLNEIGDTGSTSIYQCLDEAGRRFWIAVRFLHRHFIRKFGKPTAAEEVSVDSKFIAWAFQSDCQDDLLSSILSTDPSWIEMRNLGIGFWYTNAAQLRARMEKLARSQYLKSRSPRDCALLYLALNRLQVLAGLFKISKDEKDKVLYAFLSRNFKEEKNKAAALKNAYVLMGKHQLELAIAFFLLGGDPSSAINVCVKNLGDKQLALVICRLLEGYGGSLERHLISNILLPDTIDKGDYWLSSLLEWILGNYSQSIRTLINSDTTYAADMPTPTCLNAFSDPDIGQYSIVAAAKNSFRSAVGENLAACFSKFATFLAANALNRCGIPLEALECLSSTLSIENKLQQGISDVENNENFHGIFNLYDKDASNWLQENVARHFQLNAKLDISLRYISSLLKNYSAWSSNDIAIRGEGISYDCLPNEDVLQLGQLKLDLDIVMSMFEKKFSLDRAAVADMILLFASKKGLLFLGFLLLKDNGGSEDKGDHSSQDWTLDLVLHGLFLKAIEEIICFVARFIVSSNFTVSNLELLHIRCSTCGKDCSCQLALGLNNFQTLVYIIRFYLPVIKSFQKKIVKKGLRSTTHVLHLLEFHVNYTYARFKKKAKRLIMMVLPVLSACFTGQIYFEDVEGQLQSILHQKLELAGNDTSSDRVESFSSATFPTCQFEQGKSLICSIPEEEKWYIVGVCLWLHLSHMVKRLLRGLTVTEEPLVETSFSKVNIGKTLITSLEFVTSSLATQLGSFLRQKAIKGELSIISWLEECARNQPKSLHYNFNQEPHTLQLPESEEKLFEILWGISISPEDICTYFVKEKVNCFPFDSNRLSGSWKIVQQHISTENENEITLSIAERKGLGGTTLKEETLSRTDSMEAIRKQGDLDRVVTPFQIPKEVFRRNGELFEAVCFNSINEEQIAVASNKKGLIFFNSNAEKPLKEQAEYIWSDSEWPADGWAGCESTPIPTYVSQGVGLGSKKGAHLGLGGATIGLGSLARPGKDLTGGGAFGIPGYAGIGASGFGWGEEEFEEFKDLPATTQNIHSRAMSQHPLRPFLLVGSSNTHVYLWEFGKDRALATYGVLPAANVLPPYALASVSALQFDHCGQRFATAALNGTVCTWQLEVGGRSNVQPTDSYQFFSHHASDVTYVAASGSVLAAAGSSTNGVNAVVWDTLAPPTTCQVSLHCHEGGARSISVFNNDVGTGSISPLIVTGGVSGDVGLYDFRFIAAGKTKRPRHSSQQDFKSPMLHNADIGSSKTGDNSSGMLWYIPKAHLGSVTKISTIPNTSLFLTGSKDGDVKLWDAKNFQLVFHWQKLHDRHTFFQPNSRGLGGVARAGVTDIQVFSHGFLTCGGDGCVKVVQLT